MKSSFTISKTRFQRSLQQTNQVWDQILLQKCPLGRPRHVPDASQSGSEVLRARREALRVGRASPPFLRAPEGRRRLRSALRHGEEESSRYFCSTTISLPGRIEVVDVVGAGRVALFSGFDGGLRDATCYLSGRRRVCVAAVGAMSRRCHAATPST